MSSTLVEYYDPNNNTYITTQLYGTSPTITQIVTTISKTTLINIQVTKLIQVPAYLTTVNKVGLETSFITGNATQVASDPPFPISLLLVPATTTTSSISSTSSTSSASASVASKSATTQPAATLSYPSSSPSGSATQASPTPSQSQRPIASSKTGAIAGAAVGGLVGGALIAGLLVWLLMSSRRKRQKPGGGFASRRDHSSNHNREKSLPTAPLLGGAAASAGWEQHLPQSESDGTIRTKVKELFDKVELHVENFYHNAAVPISPEIQSGLMKVDSAHLPDSVVGLLPHTKTPIMLIKHCLAHSIVSRISTDGDTSASFLPLDFVALPHAMSTTPTNTNKPAFAPALSRWRVLSSYLRPRPQDDASYLTHRDTAIAAAADTFCTAFSPWAVSLNDLEHRRQHLVSLMKDAADTGILIFAQPSSFAYRWTVPSERERKGLVRIVVLPGFAKVKDEQARELGGARAQELVAPTVGTL